MAHRPQIGSNRCTERSDASESVNDRSFEVRAEALGSESVGSFVRSAPPHFTESWKGVLGFTKPAPPGLFRCWETARRGRRGRPHRRNGRRSTRESHQSNGAHFDLRNKGIATSPITVSLKGFFYIIAVIGYLLVTYNSSFPTTVSLK